MEVVTALGFIGMLGALTRQVTKAMLDALKLNAPANNGSAGIGLLKVLVQSVVTGALVFGASLLFADVVWSKELFAEVWAIAWGAHWLKQRSQVLPAKAGSL